DASLENAVKHLIENKPDYLPNNKRVKEGTLSTNTTAYSRARKRLPLNVVEWFAKQVSDSIVSTAPPSFDGRRVFLIDGTTIALAPEKELQLAFPAASNQFGEGVWPIALLTVFHELSTGCALLPEVGPMYGENAISETTLARRGMQKLPANSIVMGDAGFGKFSVAFDASAEGHDFVLRFKKVDFNSLRKKATLDCQSEHHKTYRHRWIPTKKNRETNPDLPPDAA
ncbi:IS4 family transposase, partial [Roseiconus lacunae]|nr:IS4 family transposase [Roseiconus lacunae]